MSTKRRQKLDARKRRAAKKASLAVVPSVGAGPLAAWERAPWYRLDKGDSSAAEVQFGLSGHGWDGGSARTSVSLIEVCEFANERRAEGTRLLSLADIALQIIDIDVLGTYEIIYRMDHASIELGPISLPEDEDGVVIDGRAALLAGLVDACEWTQQRGFAIAAASRELDATNLDDTANLARFDEAVEELSPPRPI